MPPRRNVIYVLIILSLLAGLFSGRAVFFSVAYVLGGLLIASFIWSWAAVSWISITRRTHSRRTQVGGTLEEEFIVRNRAYLPKLWLEIRDHSDLPGHQASRVIPAIGIRGSYRWHVRTVCMTRGEFQLGPITLTSGDPFGFFLSPRRISAITRLVVYPIVLPIRHIELPIGVLSGGDARRRRTPYVTTNAAGVREYMPGDSLNRIHWRSSARRGELMVKEFELDPLVDVWLFVDFSASSLVDAPGTRRIEYQNGQRGAAIPVGGGIAASTEEYAVVIAASLAQFFIESDRALGFSAYIPYREVLQPDRGVRQLNHILEALAVARSLTGLSLAQMLMLETPYLVRGTALLVITSAVETGWIAQASLLQRKGIRPMAVFIDPASFGAPADVQPVQTALRASNIPFLIVRMGDDISAALAQRPL